MINNIGPQRAAPKSLAAVRAEINQIKKELGYEKYLDLTREQLIGLLGQPTDIFQPFTNYKHRLVGIYKYNNIEYHFDQDGKVWMVFSDTDENGNNVEPITLALK